MTTMTREEIDETVESLRESRERIRGGDRELAQRFVDAVDKRVLTEQPALTPKQRSEQLFESFRKQNGNGSSAD